MSHLLSRAEVFWPKLYVRKDFQIKFYLSSALYVFFLLYKQIKIQYSVFTPHVSRDFFSSWMSRLELLIRPIWSTALIRLDYHYCVCVNNGASFSSCLKQRAHHRQYSLGSKHLNYLFNFLFYCWKQRGNVVLMSTCVFCLQNEKHADAHTRTHTIHTYYILHLHDLTHLWDFLFSEYQ